MALRLKPKVSIAETEEGTVLLDERDGRYWQLNGTAAQVLRTVLNGDSVQTAVNELTDRYPVTVEEATRDVTDLVNQLCSARLLIPSTDEPGQVGGPR